MEIIFYENRPGKSPVIKFLDSLTVSDQAIIASIFSRIESDKFQAKGANFRQLDGKLWEIKIKTPTGGYRFLYVVMNSEEMIILHAFKKKTQKTPKKELSIARKRLMEVL